MGNLILIVVAVLLTGGRWFIPTIGHSWPVVFMAVAHIYVGVLLTLLWQSRGRWALGWACLLVPTVLEALLFFAATG